MAAETAEERFERDTAYKTIDPGVSKFEDGSDRFARTFVEQSDERLDRRYVDDSDDSSALADYVDSL